MPEPIVVVSEGEKVIGSSTIWRGVNLTIEPGEMVALVGPSGSGKTTLLNCLGCLSELTSGRLTMMGQDFSRRAPRKQRQFRRRHLGYLFQNYALVESDTVLKNLQEPLRLLPRRDRPDRKEISRALADVGIEGRENSKVYHLSGGEQQRVALAGVMLKRPSMILADEPTGALDAENGALVLTKVREMVACGGAAVIATHNADVMDLCDRTIDVAHFRR
ncbi:ABC transporter ATP-binding protein [Rothia uropygialis]|uniref:ABC transporter ATP-binding protein n=1 Tax=Kocuria sp. 36 TaxID=1415402 RepID=UPI001930F1CE|nr:ATP-binding cassette domain-containing protein [Kocuria sp. 36]